MKEDLLLAQKELESGKDTLIVVKSGKVVHRTNGKGITPLFDAVTLYPTQLKDAILADTVLGSGAALLVLYGGLKAVFAEVISQKACELLDGKVDYSYKQKVPVILCETGDGTCPVEALTENVYDPERGYILIKNFLKK